MEKDTKTKQHLSEEQLQDVTGGCGQCEADLAGAAGHQEMASGYHTLSKTATDLGMIPEAREHLHLAMQHSEEARTLLERVAARGIH